MPATIFSGSFVKSLLKKFSLNGGAEIHSSTTDPTSVAVSAPRGSILLNETNGTVYRKTDNGLSTNWVAIGNVVTGTPATGNLTQFSSSTTITNGDLSGDVATSGTLSTTIQNSAVTNAKMANMAQSTIKGRAAGSGTGAPVDLTATQATAILDLFTPDSGSGGLKGLVTPPGAGTAIARSMLTADGNWSYQARGGYHGVNLMTLDTAANSWVNSKANNYDAEVSVGDWTAYADAAATTPVDMTGGSPNTTITRNTSSPISGSADLKITVTTGATRQGEGVSCLVNIPTAYRGKSLRLSFPYTTTGTISSGDFVPYAYDVTNSTLLAPSATISGITGSSGTLNATFVTQSTCAQLRVGIHIARAINTGAVTIQFDDVLLEPSLDQANIPVSDWTAYTPTFTNFGTVSTSAFFWRRNGDTVEIEGTFTSGVSSAAEARVSLPNSLVSDSTKVPAIRQCGSYFRDETTSSHGGAILIEPGVSYFTFGSADGFSGNSTNPISKANALGIGSVFKITGVKIPISGWSAGGGTSPILSLSDWTAYTPTVSGLGSTSNLSAFYRRVGDTLEVEGWVTIGSPAASLVSFTLPSNLTINSAKIPVSNTTASQGHVVGHIWGNDGSSGGVAEPIALVTATGTSTTLIYAGKSGQTANQLIPANGNAIYTNSNDPISFKFSVPILGWTSVSSGTLTAPRSGVHVYSSNGHGSTNTTIQRYSNILYSTGPDITYADSSTAGASFTINTTGVYSLTLVHMSSSPQLVGFSLNSNQLTTHIQNITASNIIGFTDEISANVLITFAATVNLNAGDVVRPHDQGNSDGSNPQRCRVIITKVSN